MEPEANGRERRLRWPFALLALVVPILVGYEVLRQCCTPAQIDHPALISGGVVALTYWAAGALLLWRRFEQSATRQFFLLSQTLAIALLPLARPWPPPADWVSGLSMVSLHAAAPLLLHCAVTFPVPLEAFLHRPWGLGLVYGLALVAAASGLAGIALGKLMFAPFVYTSVVFATAISILSYVYIRRATAGDRRRLRLTVLGSILAVVPPNLFYFIPRISGASQWMPEWLTALFLILAPVSYVYAFAQHSLIGVARLLNRALVYVLLSLGIFGLYLGPFLLIYRFLPEDLAVQLFIVAGLTLLVGLGFNWVRERVQRLVDRFFYGGWYDYPGVVETVSSALSRTLDRQQLVDVLTRQVPEMMRLREGSLWIGEADAVPEQEVTPPQLQFPLCFEDRVRGVWMVGARGDGDDFCAADRRILQTLARQAEIALSNVLLVETLQHRLDEIREAQHQLLRSREEERARVARDLHDRPIQALVGLNMQLGLLLSSSLDGDTPLGGELRAMRCEVRELLTELRQVCTELRPPILDTLGLGAALRALAEEWSAQHDVAFRLELPTDAALRSLPDEVAVNLYRVVQEALANVARHAEARQVTLHLAREGSRLSLTVQDDGRGFAVPAGLPSLTGEGHFGLVGMEERVDLIGGTLTLDSAPGQGTRVCVVWQGD
jgi:signal transduction histidine kinase